MAGEAQLTIQLVDGQGTFNEAALDSFVKAVKLRECGLSYAVVSIMGPQSSGKSTLLNHLFDTNFREMDAFKGRSQTTQGIWLATTKDIQPQTLIMDLEGTDGRERGEEKQWEEEEGLEKLLNCRKYREAYGCWDEIKRRLPLRPRVSVRHRAHLLFEKGSILGHWSKQEAELLRRRMQGKGVGVWTREEMQQLSDLVHQCLRLNQIVGRKRSHSILRDNISWDWIADRIGTHNHGGCCNKWYTSLSVGMVTDGQWSSIDDFVLLESLLESGACSEEEVEEFPLGSQVWRNMSVTVEATGKACG